MGGQLSRIPGVSRATGRSAVPGALRLLYAELRVVRAHPREPERVDRARRAPGPRRISAHLARRQTGIPDRRTTQNRRRTAPRDGLIVLTAGDRPNDEKRLL